MTSVNFLDLTITKAGGQLHTKTFFKITDRNGYIHIGSCHHPNCLKAIPKRQFQWVRRNCSRIEDFYIQANVLKKRFEDKGYDSKALEEDHLKLANVEREQLLKLKISQDENKKKGHEWAFITTFSSQHWWVNRIMTKHWNILKGDRILGPLLPNKPDIVYRRNLTLKDKLAPSAIDLPPKISMFGNLKGFFPCKRCKVCRTSQTIKTSSFTSNVTAKVYNIKDFIT